VKTTNAAVIALLNAVIDSADAVPPPSFVVFDTYTFTMPSGLALLYTTANFPISAPSTSIFSAPAVYGGTSGNVWFSGMVWKPFAIDIQQKKATCHWKVGLDADQWQVQVAPRPVDIISGATYPDTIGSQPWLAAAVSGALNSADVIVARAYFAAMPSYDPASANWIGPVGKGAAPLGTIIVFRGTIGQIDVGVTSATITINDYKSVLSQQMPRHLYQASCINRYGDNRCTINLATVTKSATASGSSSPGSIVATGSVTAPAGSSGTFALGVLTMTSGANSGLGQTVLAWDGAATFGLLRPFPYAIAGGDTFTVTAGCNKSTAHCILNSNLPNFRGNPFIPAPEISIV
jgi:uncharacterized phage protein (TIGR02218 family)